MKAFIIRILKLLSRLKIIGKVIVLRYTGAGLSLNKFYEQGHWSNRQRIKNEYKEIFDDIIKPYDNKFNLTNFYLVIFYNSKHDCDNVVGMEKIFMDCLKGRLVENDGRKHYKGMAIFFDLTLPKNTFEFVLIESLYDEYEDIMKNKNYLKDGNKRAVNI